MNQLTLVTTVKNIDIATWATMWQYRTAGRGEAVQVTANPAQVYVELADVEPANHVAVGAEAARVAGPVGVVVAASDVFRIERGLKARGVNVVVLAVAK